jgi:hypothetical protein
MLEFFKMPNGVTAFAADKDEFEIILRRPLVDLTPTHAK